MLSVCVVTPSLNQARFIERTIRSVLDQDAPGLEYVVVDGGSTDGTLDILKSYERDIRWVSEPDRGQANAVNKGITMTSGEVVGWLNADDVYYGGAVNAVVAFLEAHPEVDVVYGQADHIDEHDAPIEPYPTQPWNLTQLFDVCYVCQPATFFRRRVIERAGRLDESLHYCMDYEYWLRLAQSGARFGYLARKLAGSRLHGATKTLARRKAVHAELNGMLRRRLGRVPDRWLFNYAHALLEPTPIRPSRPLPFAIAVSALSLYAALRWNHSVSQAMSTTTTRWVAGSLRAALAR